MDQTAALANKRLFRPIEDIRPYFAGLPFSGSDTFSLTGEDLLITDPVYLADVYNSDSDDLAAYIRTSGVIVMDFGGDDSCPVFWKDPFLVLPLSTYPESDLSLVNGVTVAANEVGCDSGSFVFLPLKNQMSQQMRVKVDLLVAKKNGARISLPSGSYRVVYEQHPTPATSRESFCRNVVAYRLDH